MYKLKTVFLQKKNPQHKLIFPSSILKTAKLPINAIAKTFIQYGLP